MNKVQINDLLELTFDISDEDMPELVAWLSEHGICEKDVLKFVDHCENVESCNNE